MLCRSAISHVFDVRNLCVCVFFSASGKDKRYLPSASFFIGSFVSRILQYRHAISCMRLSSLHGNILQLMLVQSRCCIAQSRLSPLSATTDHPTIRGASRHATLARCHLTKIGSGSCISLRLLTEDSMLPGLGPHTTAPATPSSYFEPWFQIRVVLVGLGHTLLHPGDQR